MGKQAVLWVFCTGLLAACGGGGSGGAGSGVDPRLARLDLYEAQRLRVLGDPAAGVMGMPATPAGMLPDAGRVDFAGGAAILVVQSARTLSLAGDVSLTVNFGSGAANGAVTAVFGDSPGGGVVDYAGSIALSGAAQAGAFPLDYSGTLTGAGDTSLGFDGTLDTTLLGNPVAGFTAIDLQARIDQSGTLRDGSVVLFGEGPVTPPSAAP